MAAKRVLRYRGHTIRIWEKSYQINSELIVFVKTEPDVRVIQRIINVRIAANKRPLRRRMVDWFELQMGVGGDLHRQVWYAWRDYPDAMKLAMFAFVGLGAMLTVGSAMLFVALGYGYQCP